MHIYCITNLVNGKIYVGQHAGLNLDIYLGHNISHALTNNGNKTYLYRAIRKYGPDNFAIHSLIQLPKYEDLEIQRQQLNDLEIFFIRTLESQNSEIGYNIVGGGGGQLGRHYKHTEEHKKHISSIMKGRKVTWAHKISAAQKGRPLKPEHRSKLSGSQKGIPKSPRSPEHCKKISENKKKWWASVSEDRKRNIIEALKQGSKEAHGSS